MLIKSILQNNLYPISLYIRQIAGTFILFLIARYLTVHDYGLFTSYKAIATFCFLFANMEFADYILVSSQAKTKEVQLKISLFMLNAIFIGILSIICSFCFNMESHFLFLLIIIRTFFDSVFFAMILPYFQASYKLQTIAKINITYGIGITIIAITSYIFKLSLVKFLALNIILGLINFLQCSLQARIKYFLAITYYKRFFKMIDRKIFAYIGTTIAFMLYSQLPSLFVSTIIEKEQAALYFAAFTISSIISLLITAQCQKMSPELINNKLENIKIILKKNLIVMLSITVFIFIFMLILGKLLLLTLYGQPYYENAYCVLLIQCVTNIFIAIAALFGVYMMTSGHQQAKIPIQLQSALITILVLIIFNKFGIYSAVLASISGAIYMSSRFVIYSLHLLKQQEQQENIKENLCNNN